MENVFERAPIDKSVFGKKLLIILATSSPAKAEEQMNAQPEAKFQLNIVKRDIEEAELTPGTENVFVRSSIYKTCFAQKVIQM